MHIEDSDLGSHILVTVEPYSGAWPSSKSGPPGGVIPWPNGEAVFTVEALLANGEVELTAASLPNGVVTAEFCPKGEAVGAAGPICPKGETIPEDEELDALPPVIAMLLPTVMSVFVCLTTPVGAALFFAI